jgi:hypothetical protein
MAGPRVKDIKLFWHKLCQLPGEIGSQVAAWFPDMFCNFYFVKKDKITKNSTATKASEKNKHRFGILRIFDECLTKVKNNQILLNKIIRTILQGNQAIYRVKEPHCKPQYRT